MLVSLREVWLTELTGHVTAYPRCNRPSVDERSVGEAVTEC